MTAAAIGLTAAPGVAAGMGQYVIALAATGRSLLLLFFGERLEPLVTGSHQDKSEPEPGSGDADAP